MRPNSNSIQSRRVFSLLNQISQGAKNHPLWCVENRLLRGIKRKFIEAKALNGDFLLWLFFYCIIC